MFTTITSTAMILLFSLLLCFTPVSSSSGHHRHILHQPFFPVEKTIPPSLPPSVPPKSSEPKYPFSSSTPTTSTTKSFFPSSLPSPPPSPSPPRPSLATFPANISSVLFPNSSSHKPISKKLIALTISVSLLAFILLVSAFLYLFLHRKHHRHSPSIPSPNHKINVKAVSATESLRLFPQNTVASDWSFSKSPPALSKSIPSSSSTEFLYLGTLNSSENFKPSISGIKIGLQSSSPAYKKLGSPELYPLPPLPRTNLYASGEVGSSKNGNEVTDYEEEDDEEFFSPGGSSGERDGLARNGSSSRRVFMPVPIVNNSGFDKSNPPSSKSVSPVSSSLSNNSPLPAESVLNFPLQKVDLNTSPSFSSSTSSLRRESENASPVRMSDVSVGNAGEGNDENENVNVTSKQQFVPTRLPPPPPLPSRRVLDPDSGLPILEIPSRSLSAPGSLNQNSYGLEKNEDTPGPKLKPLHWDKFRASYDRAMVGDQFKSSSFRLNEEMIETLFVVNSSNNLTPKGNAWRAMSHPFNQENRVLEPKKYQNIAILLRALNVTVDEVCEALLEGNPDMLGTELLESLLKMAPTQEEENRLRKFKNQSPVKLGPAEKFLKVVLDIPFAFKRIDAILYIAKFDSEIEYLSRSFEILEVACEELRNSRMFLELLEAVLKTGNGMNVGTNRGDALAFKLDTLLKLVDVKSADDKTTILHFVVQEIMSAEGSRLSGTDQDVRVEQLRHSDLRDEVELRKLGLQVVSGLSGELTNVKKAAAMESDVLYREELKLVTGISKVSELLKLNSEVLPQEKYTLKFSECMEEFLKKAEQEIVKIQAHESVALSMVKELTEYFHGNSAKEEAHPFRIFMIVRDFLQILDQVCKEVGKINERTMVGFSHPYPIPLNPNVPYIFPGSNSTRQQNTSSDDEGTHSSSLVSGID